MEMRVQGLGLHAELLADTVVQTVGDEKLTILSHFLMMWVQNKQSWVEKKRESEVSHLLG
jgi:hypothetical protein